MKMKLWTVLAVMISSSVLADQPVAPAATSGAGVTNAAAPKHSTQRSTRRKAAPEPRTVPLTPGPAVVSANRVNVRGKAGIKSEVITQMTKGDAVTVIEEVTLRNSGADEPSAWAKIVLPQKAHVWVHASYIDTTNNFTVIPSKLNVRGGPGENFSVVATLQKGDAVKQVSKKGDWMEIEAPANAYAFMAAQYLSQEPSAIASAAPTPSDAAATNVVTEAPAIASTTTEVAPANAAVTNEVALGTNEIASASTNDMGSETPVVEPPPPRIVQREGLVRGTTSIQAPTKFELIGTDSHRVINYLYTTSTNLDLSRYKGLHIIVTGQEGLDERWKNAPVITIHKIVVLD